MADDTSPAVIQTKLTENSSKLFGEFYELYTNIQAIFYPIFSIEKEWLELKTDAFKGSADSAGAWINY